jgi:hypothetical protein
MAREREREEFDPSVGGGGYAQPHHFSINFGPSPAAMQQAMSAPGRTKRILAAAAAKTRHPEVRAMLERDEGGQWSRAVHETDALAERLGGPPMTEAEHDGYIADLVRLEALDRAMRPEHYRRNKPRGEVDEAAAEALELWIDNTAELSPAGPRGQGREIVKNLIRKIRKGTYDPKQAPKLWGYLMESGAKHYVKESGERTPWHVKFNTATRAALAERYARQFEQDYEAGEYDHVDVSIRRNSNANEGLVASQVERLPVGSIVYSYAERMALTVTPDGGLAPITVLPERAGGWPPDGEPVASFGQEFALVKYGSGKLLTHRTAHKAVLAWMQEQPR